MASLPSNYSIHLTRRAGPQAMQTLPSTLLIVEELHMRIRGIVAATAVFALLGLFHFDAIFAGRAAAQTEPMLFQPGPGGAPLPPNRDVCWGEPPDLEGYIFTSEVIEIYGFESRVANDFRFDADRTIGRIRWWGGYFGNTAACEPGQVPPGFILRVYHDIECLPDVTEYGSPYAEFIVEGAAGETYVGCQQSFYPMYRYEASVDLPIASGVRWWISVQMADHGYPPQWGRLATATITGCESAYFTRTLEWPEWYPISSLIGTPLDFSQEFECEAPVAIQQSSWGRIRAVYR